ncbi:hypothetical protein [Okeania sp. SIO2G5]|uniref:hypothetical protein n=1 Tax=Okeania sp. SIO2G5 TaxID=2607796 RepID=UPI00257D142F|nr:hypothetical protein [Okeania sp. SIO2G5]
MASIRSMHFTESSAKRLKRGTCPFCGRETALTFHHLIPKKMHRRNYFKKNYSKTLLNQGVDICRPCHSGIHHRYDEMTLAKQFSSLDALMNDASLQKHFQWVAKQKVKHR